MQRKKICYVVSSLFTARTFMYNHILAATKDYEVTLIASSDKSNIDCFVKIGVNVLFLDIKRQISLSRDLIALYKLVLICNKSQFDIVHSVTPKAGLLSMISAWLTKVPLRIHTFTGQVWVTKAMLKRFFLKKIDVLIAYLTTYNIVDSPSQFQFLLAEKVITSKKSLVFSKGSISGVDSVRFKSNLQARQDIRKQLNISANAILFLFLGRLTRDKGVLDLIQSFISLKKGYAHLLFVGPDEQNMQAEIVRISGKDNPDVHFIGHTDIPESYMSAADVLCLPSYREGFGTVVIEAAAVGIPSIASRIYGLTDAVVDGKTGLLYEPHDTEGLSACMQQMISNKELRIQLGEQAHTRAIQEFDSKLITQLWLDFYREHVA